VKQIDRPKLTENVAREALMQYRDRTIEFIAPVALAAMRAEFTAPIVSKDDVYALAITSGNTGLSLTNPKRDPICPSYTANAIVERRIRRNLTHVRHAK
jgi:hypothetical protein